jgi:hydroxymethylglutaryl-CoA lyase
MGIETGIDLTRLVEAIDIVAPSLSRSIDTGYYTLLKRSTSVV